MLIITAVQNPESTRALSDCLENLGKCNISDKNITIYDMHFKLSQDELSKHDAIYACGGSTDYLVRRMDKINFKKQIIDHPNNGGIYVGTSARIKAVSGYRSNDFNLLLKHASVRCSSGTATVVWITNGADVNAEMRITDNQAIFTDDKNITIFE